jgi:hypothetical protein
LSAGVENGAIDTHDDTEEQSGNLKQNSTPRVSAKNDAARLATAARGKSTLEAIWIYREIISQCFVRGECEEEC